MGAPTGCAVGLLNLVANFRKEVAQTEARKVREARAFIGQRNKTEPESNNQNAMPPPHHPILR